MESNMTAEARIERRKNLRALLLAAFAPDSPRVATDKDVQAAAILSLVFDEVFETLDAVRTGMYALADGMKALEQQTAFLKLSLGPLKKPEV